MNTWKPVVSTSDFNSMKRKAGTLAAIAGARALTENPGVSNIGGSGMDFGELSKKVGVARAAKALEGEPRPEVGLSAPAPEAEAEAEAAPDESSATMARFLRSRQQARASTIGSTTLNPLDPLTRGLSTLGLQRGGTVDYRAGGPVSGGPPGRDTIPVVDYPGGQAEAMVDNGEYVLPRKTVKQIGKSELDKLVVKTTGEKPVGYAGGGFFDRFRNRGKQIDAAVDAATTAKVPEPEPKPAPSTSMRDIMREIRRKNPPTKQPVRRYKDGGLMTERERIRARMQDAQPLPKLSAVAGRPGAGYSSSRHGAGLINLLLSDTALQKKQQHEWARDQEAAPAPVTPSSKPEAPLGVQPPVGDSEVPGAAPLESEQPPAAPVPQDSVIRRASPEEAGFGESVNLSRSGDVRTYSAAFSPENVARARSEAQTFEANNPLSQARTVEDINADTEALRDLRRVRTNLADGRPADYGKPAVAASAPAKLSDMIGLANLQRGFSNDQRAAGQARFSNNIALSKEQRQQAEARNAQQDRFAEQATALMPEIAQQAPWMQESAAGFFQQAAEANLANPRQAMNLLMGTQEELAKRTEEVLFKYPKPDGGTIDITGAQAIAILNGDQPLGGWFSGMTDEIYDAIRRQAAAAVQQTALTELAQ